MKRSLESAISIKTQGKDQNNIQYHDKKGAIPESPSKRQRRRARESGGIATIIKDEELPTQATGGIPNMIKNDEIQLPKDPEGEKKVDELGTLKDGREYRIKTIKIRDRGEQLFMISSEAARCFGFQEINRFFLQHPRLRKLLLTDQERQQLVQQRILPEYAKENESSVVTARSIFREFGAQVIIGGRTVIDDYEVTIVRASGRVEGELAVPEDTNFRVKYDPGTRLFMGFNVSDGPNDRMNGVRRHLSWDGLRRKWMDNHGDIDR